MAYVIWLSMGMVGLRAALASCRTMAISATHPLELKLAFLHEVSPVQQHLPADDLSREGRKVHKREGKAA
jgi:hypothetical protein